jgi:hypothetical protein
MPKKLQIRSTLGLLLYEAEVPWIKELISRAIKDSADLSGAGLSSADLSGADLRSANLSGANLSGADLRSAIGLPAPVVCIAGSRDLICMLGADDVRIGCKHFKLNYWERKYRKIGMTAGYSSLEIEEYGDYIRLLRRRVDSHMAGVDSTVDSNTN